MSSVLTVKRFVVFALVCVAFGAARDVAAQSGVAPTVIPLNGRLLTATGEPRTGTVVLAIALFDGQNDPSARFVEMTLPVTLDGHYAAKAGTAIASVFLARGVMSNSVQRGHRRCSYSAWREEFAC